MIVEVGILRIDRGRADEFAPVADDDVTEGLR